MCRRCSQGSADEGCPPSTILSPEDHPGLEKVPSPGEYPVEQPRGVPTEAQGTVDAEEMTRRGEECLPCWQRRWRGPQEGRWPRHAARGRRGPSWPNSRLSGAALEPAPEPGVEGEWDGSHKSLRHSPSLEGLRGRRAGQPCHPGAPSSPPSCSPRSTQQLRTEVGRTVV